MEIIHVAIDDDDNKCMVNNHHACIAIIGGVKGIFIPKEKENRGVKNFHWYVREYFTNRQSFTDLINDKGHERLAREFSRDNFNAVPFEMRIGLLKFICDDLNTNIFNVISAHRSSLVNTLGLGQDKIFAICPKDFLNSLIE